MWPNPPETADLVTFTEEILNGKLHFLCNVSNQVIHIEDIEDNIQIWNRQLGDY